MNVQTDPKMGSIALPRRVSWLVLVVFLIVDALLLVLINQVLFPSNVLVPLYRATSGLVNPTLQASLLRLLVAVIIVLVFFGKLEGRDLGLLWRRATPAVIITLAIWLLAQLIALLVSMATTGRWELDPYWAKLGWTGVLGLFIGQVFGNALVEEVEYRGFLLPQLYLKLQVSSPRRRLTFAIVGALIIFTLMHIPNRLMRGVSLDEMALDLLIIVGWSLMLSVIYLVTGNLLIAVGVHALIDAPTMVFASGLVPQFAIALAAVVVLGIKLGIQRTGSLPSPRAISAPMPSK